MTKLKIEVDSKKIKQPFSKLIMFQKTIKNIAIVWGIPMAVTLITNAEAWVPKEYLPIAKWIIGAASYAYKNYRNNK